MRGRFWRSWISAIRVAELVVVFNKTTHPNTHFFSSRFYHLLHSPVFPTISVALELAQFDAPDKTHSVRDKKAGTISKWRKQIRKMLYFDSVSRATSRNKVFGTKVMVFCHNRKLKWASEPRIQKLQFEASFLLSSKVDNDISTYQIN